jgi:hypothetical protein
MATETLNLIELISLEYLHAFSTDLQTDTIKKGQSEPLIRMIAAKKDAPEFMLE